MLTVTLCVIASCDTCFAQPNITSGKNHFDTESAALATLAKLGWWATATGALLCPACAMDAAERLCQQRGHLWAPWRPCWCHGKSLPHTTPGRPAVCGGELRWCARCQHGETRFPGTGTKAVA
ncbi:hypothetical protein N8J89_12790 [Crossiella sp. CA-258035]|uniref:hypothetical protein n=1 Tax=Crossiella sp. CA-258035 TaxID=2981138 RepID=UPI0024BCC0BF|nr:hypothetical protein [Crossiella sp. CA-258035]WHT21897.1 hypothetical protein N8J89_12790 [Crossiella sp. CA-258035]